ncbi:MAG TPA: sugar ABC transporter substrate-binding protein [Gemmatimonadota bacterium]|nr:sugar ABC transporter substrate-binding protein [Gemmatimonadota bacterium]
MSGRGAGLLVVLLAACTGDPADGVRGPNLRVVVVTHGQSADPFWSIVSNGAHAAGEDLGIDVEYQAPLSFDMVEMANLIEAAAASRPDGLVVSIPDPAALGGAIRAAVGAGIPVVSTNSGDDAWARLGAIAHVGQPEYEAGVAAGERLSGSGVTRALCVNHEVGNAALDRRCAGLRAGLAASGGTVEVLAVDLADPDAARERIAGALAARPETDGVLALGPAGAAPALAAVRGIDAARRPALATFDLSPEVLRAVESGEIAFAVDQQPFLQGYLPVVLLAAHARAGVAPGGGGVVATGPGFVTRENAAAVIELSAEGLR